MRQLSATWTVGLGFGGMDTDAISTAPGRLGDADMCLATDPRADPRLVAGLAPFGIDRNAEPSGVDGDSPRAEQLAASTAAEAGLRVLFSHIFSDLPEIHGVERSVETIDGSDGNSVRLHIHTPAAATTQVPCVLHLHGGGMAMLGPEDAQFARWRDELAGAGVVAIGVEFRNSGGADGAHPFPAGLNDCTSALLWTHAHRARLGVSTIVVSGDSGGGNLTLATTLRAKRDGNLDAIDGVYAQCPYISGLYSTKPVELMSMRENDGYFLDTTGMACFAALYDPSGEHATDPLAWPYHATIDELAGLPPHVISVNELDPLRDEGIAYHRKLCAAGVRSVCRTINGTSHASDAMFRAAIPDVYAATLRDLVGFAYAL
jgi:acetyl esterase/lipase